jgi:hypothetical protein
LGTDLGYFFEEAIFGCSREVLQRDCQPVKPDVVEIGISYYEKFIAGSKEDLEYKLDALNLKQVLPQSLL